MQKKKNITAFTLIELMVSMVIFSILILITFNQLTFVAAIVIRVNNQTTLNYTSINLKEEFNKENISVAFYNYDDLIGDTESFFETEKIFRRNIRDLIEDLIDESTGENNYSLTSPLTCKLPYTLGQYMSEKDIYKIEEEFDINDCYTDIHSTLFKEKYKILVIVNKKIKDVKIYFLYKGTLQKISTLLNTDLSEDDILITDITLPYVTIVPFDTFYTHYFTGSTQNKCNNTTLIECIFYDFSFPESKPGVVKAQIMKITRSGTDINLSTSASIKTSYVINKYR